MMERYTAPETSRRLRDAGVPSTSRMFWEPDGDEWALVDSCWRSFMEADGRKYLLPAFDLHDLMILILPWNLSISAGLVESQHLGQPEYVGLSLYRQSDGNCLADSDCHCEPEDPVDALALAILAATAHGHLTIKSEQTT